MKRLLATLLAIFAIATLSAQPHGSHHSHGNHHGTPTPPPPPSPTIVVEAQRGETFQVYIDGDLVNAMPQSQVVASCLGGRNSEVIVVLHQPARKAATIQVAATPQGTPVTVVYDNRQQLLRLVSQPSRPTTPAPPAPNTHPNPPAPNTPPMIVEHRTPVSDAWVSDMISLIKKQPFDSEKLATAKSLLGNPQPFTVSQISRITQTLDFSSSQVDFLKAAYSHCYDPENYERAIAILKHSSDRKKVRNHISFPRH